MFSDLFRQMPKWFIVLWLSAATAGIVIPVLVVVALIKLITHL